MTSSMVTRMLDHVDRAIAGLGVVLLVVVILAVPNMRPASRPKVDTASQFPLIEPSRETEITPVVGDYNDTPADPAEVADMVVVDGTVGALVAQIVTEFNPDPADEVVSALEATLVFMAKNSWMFVGDEDDWPGRVATIMAVMSVESGFDPDCPAGDNGAAVGVLQIHPVMVEDCVRIARLNGTDATSRFTVAAREDPRMSIVMFITYTNHYTPTWDADKAARRWNGGPTGDVNPATDRYAERFHSARARILEILGRHGVAS